MNDPAETSAKESAISLFIKGLDPKAKPNASDKKAAGALFKAFQAKKQAALKVLKDLETEEGEVSRACLRAFGKEKLSANGVDFVPTSRDERIYYKEMSGKSIEL